MSERRNIGVSDKKPRGLVRTAGRLEEVVAFEKALVDFFVEAAVLLGVPKSVGAIYGICFASPEPLSFSEINERLEISSGSISQGVKVLREVGAFKLASEKADKPTTDTLTVGPDDQSGEQLNGRTGSDRSIDRATARLALVRARERYEPDLELRKIVTHYIEQRLQKQLDSGHARLKGIAKLMPTKSAAEAERFRERFHSLQTWHAKTRALLPIAKTFLKLT